MFEETRLQLAEFMEQSGKTQKQISKETGLSTALISQFLSNTYTGDNAEAAKTINQYLTVAKDRLNVVKTDNFVEGLHNTHEVMFACYFAHKNNEIALVSGDAGAGKTTALKHYAANNTGVIMVTANACTTTATAILTLICKQIERTIPGRRAALMQMLVEQLNGTNRLIIVDEADHLSFDALQAVRNLNDLAGVGIVFSGNDKIYRQMFSPQRGYEFDQIRTRIFIRKKVVNSYTLEEGKQLFPGLNQDAITYLLKVACSDSLRTAKKLFTAAGDLSRISNKPITAKLIKDTQRHLCGEVVA